MRTREEVFAQRPLQWDVIVWRPDCSRFERHASHDTLPVEPRTKFLTCAEDLAELFPYAGLDVFRAFMEQVTGRPVIAVHSKPYWGWLWKALRNMPLTVPGAVSVGKPPKDCRSRLYAPKLTQKKPGRRQHHSGYSTPTAPRGAPGFRLLYRPGEVEAMDVRFLELRRIERALVEALVKASRATGKTDFNRAEVCEILTADPKLADVSRQNPWDAFAFNRAVLVRGGFIACQRYKRDGSVEFEPARPLQRRVRRKEAA